MSSLIKTICVEADYCFSPEPLRLEKLGKVNFLFAPNGTGKTTISRALSLQPAAIEHRREWAVASTQLRIRVFNEEYRTNVLTEHVEGIFTLGEQSKVVNEQLKQIQGERAERFKRRSRIQEEIGSEVGAGLTGELVQIRNHAEESLWREQGAVPLEVRRIAFSGFRGSKITFFDEALRRWEGGGLVDPSVTWEDLALKVESISGAAEEVQSLPTIQTGRLLSDPELDLLAAPLLPKGDGRLAKLIDALGNSEWVNQGRRYYPNPEKKCPFCQEVAPADLERELQEFFSSVYQDSQRALESLLTEVKSRFVALSSELGDLETILADQSGVDSEVIRQLIADITSAASSVVADVGKKVEHPAEEVRPATVSTQIKELNAKVISANLQIGAHNRVVSNTRKARADIVEQGWALFLHATRVQAQIKQYLGQSKSKQKRIKDCESELTDLECEDRKAQLKAKELRESISNTHAVAESINDQLLAMGLRRFKLRVADSVAGGYRIVRNDGSAAYESLSEGEKTFLCFTYFWESLRGTLKPDETVEELAVVIDDPISSLDSDSLFIVADTIREGAQEVFDGASNVRQLVVMTHNTQFHHEASYSNEFPKKRRRFYRLQRGTAGNSVVRDDGDRSQIRNNYALLWDYVVQAANDESDGSVLQTGLYNIVRRIIETYFRLLGKVSEEEWPQELSATEKKMLSLFSTWANARSHQLGDDLEQYMALGQVHQFLKLFRDYFYHRGQQAHFKMMIKSSHGKDLLEKGGLFYRPDDAKEGVGETPRDNAVVAG